LPVALLIALVQVFDAAVSFDATVSVPKPVLPPQAVNNMMPLDANAKSSLRLIVLMIFLLFLMELNIYKRTL
jgi:hypothetical protein